jgi:diguanylate cyclase (GGDEF)-like protein
VRNATLPYGERPEKPCLAHVFPRRLPAGLLGGLFFAGLLFACLAAGAETAPPLSGKLRLLTTAHEAHSLTSEEAARACPIHIRGVVTYFDPSIGHHRAALFVHDATGEIYVETPEGLIGDITAGTLIDVRGVSGAGEFGPVIEHPQIKVIGHSKLPAHPPRPSLALMQTGILDSQWIEAEGVIRSFAESKQSKHYVLLQLAMEGGTVPVIMIKVADANYSGLVGARVRIHAHASPTFSNSHQMIGIRLMCPGLSEVKILEASPRDPFNLPIVPIDKLLRWDQVHLLAHQVRLRGRVTLLWPGSSVCIRDDTRGICAQTNQSTPLRNGELVDVVGFVGVEGGAPVLTDAIYRSAGGDGSVPASLVTINQVMQGAFDSELIQIDGQLIGKDMASSDTPLLLASGANTFAAILPKTLTGSEADAWKIGSKLRVTGICSVQLDKRRGATGTGMAVPKSFRVLIRSADDVTVLQRSSWWTAGHVLMLLALALTGAVVALVWAVVLRRRVEQQTILLRESEKRFRHMAQHDSLTGLTTRLVFEDRLDVALESARRHHTELALLMLDLDNFKDVNDMLGHQAGDEVLRITAERIVGAVRKSDTVARMGGDEFMVLLSDLHAPDDAESVAAKVVTALSVPIPVAGGEAPVSVSAGVCTVSSGKIDADTLFKNADMALYRAKALGRNCFQSYTPELAQSQMQ